jgi:hypothetical protein
MLRPTPAFIYVVANEAHLILCREGYAGQGLTRTDRAFFKMFSFFFK